MDKRLAVTVGAVHRRSFEVSESAMRAFAEATGDHNPVHFDDSYAAGTRFGRRIAHGMLLGGYISAVLGTDFPGPGTVYLSQTLRFLAPCHPGDRVTVTVQVKSVRADKPIAVLDTVCTNDAGESLAVGEAVVLIPACAPEA